MIHFVIYEDNSYFSKNISHIVDLVMMNVDQFQYKIYCFNDYDEHLKALIEEEISFKIYILDVVAPTKSGIEIARMVRNNDTESMIIFLSAHYNDYLKEILKGKFMFLDFIDKEGDYQKELEGSIQYALSNITKKNIIRFKSKGVTYTILSSDILYIAREKDRTCTIQTVHNCFTVWKTLTELKELLDPEFEYSYRSCIVNLSRVQSHDPKKKLITFDNGMTIDLVSIRFQLKK